MPQRFHIVALVQHILVPHCVPSTQTAHLTTSTLPGTLVFPSCTMSQNGSLLDIHSAKHACVPILYHEPKWLTPRHPFCEACLWSILCHEPRWLTPQRPFCEARFCSILHHEPGWLALRHPFCEARSCSIVHHEPKWLTCLDFIRMARLHERRLGAPPPPSGQAGCEA